MEKNEWLLFNFMVTSISLLYSLVSSSLFSGFVSEMASLHSLITVNSTIIISQSVSVLTTFNGESLNIRRSNCPTRRQSPCFNIRHCIVSTMIKTTKIQFIQGTDEITIPDVKLTKSRDGTNGKAVFRFVQPSVFDLSRDLSEITGFFMTDEEGLLQSVVDVSAKFVDGKPFAIEVKYIMKTPRDWDRFIRFMERYSKDNGLQFIKT